MKLLRFGHLGEEKPGILDNDGHIRDISAYVLDVTPNALSERSTIQQLQALDLSTLPVVDPSVRLGSCVGLVGKVICIGFNSRQHAQEMGVDRSKNHEPVVFMKPTSALSGPNDPILYCPHTKKLDWEAELAVVIGKQGKYIAASEAKDYIFGYTCMNDLSERFLQFETEDAQFTKGKCFDGSAPLGPYLVTKSEIPDAHHLQIKLWVNDKLRQDFNTNHYIYNEEQIIAYVSQYFTLYPGDVISMGSAPGSACAWGDDCFLRPGDEVRLQIEGLGEQRQVVIHE